MSPELAALATVWGMVVNYGPWFVVFLLCSGGVWAVKTRQLFLAREYDKLADDCEKATAKATEREKELVAEVQFWRTRHLQQLELAQSALTALNSGGSRGPTR